jgi:hypothetical protein
MKRDDWKPNKRLQNPGRLRGRDHRKHRPEDAAVHKTQVVRVDNDFRLLEKLRPWPGLAHSQEEANHFIGYSSESSIGGDRDVPVLHYLINEER